MRLFYFIAAFFLIIPHACFAATYYVSPSGSNSNPGTSVSPWLTISYGVSRMAGGDTLILKDGTYSGDSNAIVNPPSGSSGAYTTIKAENPWGATITGVWGYQATMFSNGGSYIWIDGIKFKSTKAPKVYFYGAANHFKVTRCMSDGAGGTSSSFLAGGEASYGLFQDCFAYGCGRYPFDADCSSSRGAVHHIIFRRCLVRWDYSLWTSSSNTQPVAAFAAYQAANVAWQNCIAIDGLDIDQRNAVGGASEYQGVSPYYGICAFKTPNAGSDTTVKGSLVLNFQGPAVVYEKSGSNVLYNHRIEDLVAYDIKEDYAGSGYKPSGLIKTDYDCVDSTIYGTRITAGAINCSATAATGVVFVSEYSNVTREVYNSIFINNILNSGEYVITQGLEGENYNDFYGNTGNRNSVASLGVNDLTTNPVGTSLKYLPRIEDGSVLKTAGSGGGQIGAQIMYQHGANNTLWGETGWNSTTTTPLWPWPYEDTIRTECRSLTKSSGELWTGSPAIDGKRGFAADGQTLTKYIWEYLGNTIPADIYAGAPAALVVDTSGLNNGTVGTAYSQALVASGGTAPYTWSITSGSLPGGLSLNASSGAITGTPTAAGTSSFTVRVTDSASATASKSLSIVIAIYNNAPVLASIGSKSVTAGSTLQFTVSATDADADTLTYSASGLPSGAAFSNRVFSWTPDASQIDMYAVTFTVSDGKGSTDSEVVTINVSAAAQANNAPVLAAIGSKTVTAGTALQFTVSATDADQDTLTYSASALPTGATFSSGGFNWTPNSTQTGTHSITFTVTDSNGASDSETITITVQASGSGPSPSDTIKPAITNMNPKSGEVQVPRYTSIMFHLTDAGSGVNKSSIAVTVQREGDAAASTIIQNGTCAVAGAASAASVQGTAADYSVVYEPPNTASYRFNYDQEIIVRVSATDVKGNTLDYTYRFTTAVINKSRSKKIR